MENENTERGRVWEGWTATLSTLATPWPGRAATAACSGTPGGGPDGCGLEAGPRLQRPHGPRHVAGVHRDAHGAGSGLGASRASFADPWPPVRRRDPASAATTGRGPPSKTKISRGLRKGPKIHTQRQTKYYAFAGQRGRASDITPDIYLSSVEASAAPQAAGRELCEGPRTAPSVTSVRRPSGARDRASPAGAAHHLG